MKKAPKVRLLLLLELFPNEEPQRWTVFSILECCHRIDHISERGKYIEKVYEIFNLKAHEIIIKYNVPKEDIYIHNFILFRQYSK